MSAEKRVSNNKEMRGVSDRLKKNKAVQEDLFMEFTMRVLGLKRLYV